ncbi:MAG TPA: UDP-N-acetylglucosamine--N-acetylmuramyl-(pentapeptide) pyrophosphoryl-undecaprenol N-acetylglucosamine transferase [Phycisphaerae bacterium]|nr:UDP-N-acetylglucosamine--N-acetylmuramyl-(pentapeptide) pyrophosphoryl-undecaprenol N-acetylglucosamine transferase [Phycisphaerae bacterium]
MPSRPLIVLAGGGTGGHLFPAVAVAEAIQQANREVELLVLATDRPLDRAILEATTIAWRPQPVRPLPERPWRFPAFYLAWRRSLGLVRQLMQQQRPVAVLGTGGYGAGPAVHAARQLHVPTALLNPDRLPGRANRHLANWVKIVFAQWPQSAVAFPPSVDVRAVGCPVRRAFREVTRADGVAKFGLDPNRKTLLITGASQGARTVNRAMICLLDRLVEHRAWQVLHLSGELDYAEVRQAYTAAGLTGTVLAFTDSMAHAMAAADLVVSRAGASTLAELTCMGRPSVLLPYPFDRQRHQLANARVLCEAGAAVLVDDQIDPQPNAALLGPALDALIGDPGRLEAMSLVARQLGRPDAAAAVARDLLELAGISPNRGGDRIVPATP